MPIDFGFILLFVNCLVLAGTFIYAYLKPKEWNEWLVVSSRTYFKIYIFTMFLVSLLAGVFIEFKELDFLSVSMVIFWLAVCFWGIKHSLSESGGKSLLPFLLYISSIGQQFFRAFTSLYLSAALRNLALVYFLGGIAIYFGGRAIGYLLRRFSPSLYNEHITLMEENRSITLGFSPSDFVGIGIVYCIWMIVSYSVL